MTFWRLTSYSLTLIIWYNRARDTERQFLKSLIHLALSNVYTCELNPLLDLVITDTGYASSQRLENLGNFLNEGETYCSIALGVKILK